MGRSGGRKDHLDVARGLGIVLVILGHSLELYLGASPFRATAFTAWKFIYSFHMPLFFLLSGMATTKLAGTDGEKALAGALQLIVLATALQLLSAPLRLALPWPGETSPSSVADALRYVLWPAIKLEGYAIVVIWFLPCLALVRLSVWLMANTSHRTATGAVALLAALCLAAQSLGIGYFQMRSIIVGVGFFAAGQRLGDLPIDRLPQPAYAAALAAGLLLTALTFDANEGCPFSLMASCPGPRYGAFAVLMVSGSFGFLPLFLLTALSGAAAILAAAVLLAASPARRWLTLIGRRTLELLIVNGAVLVFVQPLLSPHVTDVPPPLVILPFVLAQLATAAALHPMLSGFLASTRNIAARLSQKLPRAPAICRASPRR